MPGHPTISLRVMASAITLAGLMAACVGENSTGPIEPEVSLDLIPDDCGPTTGAGPSEVSRSVQGDTETLTLNFENSGGAAQCVVFQNADGIFFQDTANPLNGVYYMRVSNAIPAMGAYQNLPSGVRAAAKNRNSWRIRFDPPVRRIEFEHNATGTITVQALNQFGGLLSSSTLEDDTSCYDLLPEECPNWRTHVVAVGSDAIYELWTDFNFYMDDLKITRAAPPQITCDTVPRGSPGTCGIDGGAGVASVLSWRFVPSQAPLTSTISGYHEHVHELGR